MEVIKWWDSKLAMQSCSKYGLFSYLVHLYKLSHWPHRLYRQAIGPINEIIVSSMIIGSRPKCHNTFLAALPNIPAVVAKTLGRLRFDSIVIRDVI